MKRFLVLIMASVFFASGMPPAESRAAEEYVLSLNLPIPPIHNRWHFALKPVSYTHLTLPTKA